MSSSDPYYWWRQRYEDALHADHEAGHPGGPAECPWCDDE